MFFSPSSLEPSRVFPSINSHSRAAAFENGLVFRLPEKDDARGWKLASKITNDNVDRRLWNGKRNLILWFGWRTKPGPGGRILLLSAINNATKGENRGILSKRDVCKVAKRRW